MDEALLVNDALIIQQVYQDSAYSDMLALTFTRHLNYAKAHWMRDGENPPVGIILCSQKGAAQAHYALEGLPNKVLAVRYQTLLPSADQLADELRRASKQLAERGRV